MRRRDEESVSGTRPDDDGPPGAAVRRINILAPWAVLAAGCFAMWLFKPMALLTPVFLFIGHWLSLRDELRAPAAGATTNASIAATT